MYARSVPRIRPGLRKKLISQADEIEGRGSNRAIELGRQYSRDCIVDKGNIHELATSVYGSLLPEAHSLMQVDVV